MPTYFTKTSNSWSLFTRLVLQGGRPGIRFKPYCITAKIHFMQLMLLFLNPVSDWASYIELRRQSDTPTTVNYRRGPASVMEPTCGFAWSRPRRKSPQRKTETDVILETRDCVSPTLQHHHPRLHPHELNYLVFTWHLRG